jgi:hypothetical protein
MSNPPLLADVIARGLLMHLRMAMDDGKQKKDGR